MKKVSAVLATLFPFALATPVFADEIGPAHPFTTDSTTSMTVDDTGAELGADDEADSNRAGLFEYVLGLFE